MFGITSRTDSSSPRCAAASKLSAASSPELIPHIHALADSLKSATPEQLISEANLIRLELARGQSPSEPHLLVAGLSLACEALRRTVDVRLYDVQLLAAMAVSRRCVAQMQTGEGKTLVAITAALHLSLTGRGVHVVTPNAYLARRDQELAARIAAALGISAVLLPEKEESAKKASAYDSDITYGTGAEFGFDYLRDQLTLRQQARLQLGERLLRNLEPDASTRRVTMQRGLAFAIVDEADSVLIDDAGSPLVLSVGTNEPAPDTQAHLTARELAAILKPGEEYVCEPASGRIALTEAGVQRCHAADVAIPVLQLVRPWTEYVQQALRARYLFRRDVHYVIQDEEVRIVDETTGRIFEDRSWQDGLHQAIEASQGLLVTSEKYSVAQVTKQRFFRLYEHLSGMTGTAIGCERELQDVYGLSVEEIPLSVESQRILLPIRFFATGLAKSESIVTAAVAMQQQGRAVLIGTRSISDSEVLATLLSGQGISFQLLNGLQNADEAQIISEAGKPGAITIATNLAGRGTDIVLDHTVKARGGLHVIVAECQTSGRMDRQLIGRCARQGDPGSAQMFVSADDTLLTCHGPWLAAALSREADGSQEIHSDFSVQLHRIQSAAERRQYASRIAMLRRDMARDTMLRSTQ